jgi:chemotaxis protein methyltransferase CheR
MQDTTFNVLADLALSGSGQAIQKSKTYLIEARLAGLARREGFGTMDDLVHCLKARSNAVFAAEVAAALVSKDTRFFRERDILIQLITSALPERLKASNTGRLKVWCAGGGTGQEAYSLAMMLQEPDAAPLKGAKIEILSTDICKATTDAARIGQFGHFDIQKGLSIHRLLEHFTHMDTGMWDASDALRASISFRQHNLMKDCSGLGKHDIILCRNVLSGMARTARMMVVERLAGQLVPGGMIQLGEGESLIGLTDRLEPAPTIRGAWVAAGTANSAAAAAA